MRMYAKTDWLSSHVSIKQFWVTALLGQGILANSTESCQPPPTIPFDSSQDCFTAMLISLAPMCLLLPAFYVMSLADRERERGAEREGCLFQSMHCNTIRGIVLLLCGGSDSELSAFLSTIPLCLHLRHLLKLSANELQVDHCSPVPVYAYELTVCLLGWIQTSTPSKVWVFILLLKAVDLACFRLSKSRAFDTCTRHSLNLSSLFLPFPHRPTYTCTAMHLFHGMRVCRSEGCLGCLMLNQPVASVRLAQVCPSLRTAIGAAATAYKYLCKFIAVGSSNFDFCYIHQLSYFDSMWLACKNR